jgi:hypothetical protein
MRAGTVRFVKQREAPGGQLWYITCDGDGGSRGTERWAWTVAASPDNEGKWSTHSVSGGEEAAIPFAEADRGRT